MTKKSYQERQQAGKEEMEQLCKDYQLTDCFRYRFPTTRSFTWQRSDHTNKAKSRLDRLYVQSPLDLNIKTVHHRHCTFSDHKYVDLILSEIKTQKLKPGPGYWKLNAKLLEDPVTVSKIEDLWRVYFKPCCDKN